MRRGSASLRAAWGHASSRSSATRISASPSAAYLPAILKGLATTSRHFFRNLAGWLSGKRTAFVVQYPRSASTIPTPSAACRCWSQLDDGLPKCVACGLCEFACPTDCITIVPGELPEHGIERYPDAFDIDMSRCMFCGLCEEACPEEAIVMSREVELASYDRGSMLYDKPRLLVPANLLKRRLEFIRAEYDRQHAPPFAERR